MSKRQMSKTVQTGLSGGEYTNIIDGSRVSVGGDGSATIEINNPGDTKWSWMIIAIRNE